MVSSLPEKQLGGALVGDAPTWEGEMQFLNRARHLVFLRLNTGDTVHLAPGELSRQLESFETDRNAQLERLVRIGVVAAVEAKPAAAKRGPKS